MRWASLGAVLLACQTPGRALAQTVYNYTGTKSTATWSAPTTWTPASGTGTAYPGSDGINTADTANIVNVPITTALTYDVGATGYVGTLNMTQNTTNVGTTLQLAQNLMLNQGGAITSSLNGNNLETVNLGNFTLTVGGAANLTLGLASATTLGGGTPITTTGTGAVAINGTVTVASAVTLLETINAPVTLNGGTITVNDNGSAVKNVLTLTGNFTSTGNAVLQATGANAAGATIVFQGASTTISAGTTTTGSPTFSFLNAGAATTTQTVSLGALLPNTLVRNGSTAGTITKIFSSSATSGTVGNAVDSILLQNQKGASSLVFTLGSNLNLAASQTTPFTFNLVNGSSSAVVQDNIDLAGFAYNAAASTSTLAFAPAASTSAGSSQINIINSGASSISGGNGIFQAASFALNTSDIGIGSGVILQASGGTGTVNNLGLVTNGVTAINPASTFYYTGAGTTASPATLTSARTIGALTVGNGTTPSNLQLATANLTTAGSVTVASGSTLQLGARTLTLSAGNLMGNGTVAGTTAGAATTGNAVTFSGTGGIAPGTVGTVGMLSLVGTQAVTLASGSTSAFDLASGTSFDQLTIGGGNVTLVYNGTLALNFLNGYAPTSGTFQIVSPDALASGNFTSITSNLANDSFAFNPTSGVLSITAVPEPATMAQIAIVLATVLRVGASKQTRRRVGGRC